MRGTPRVMRLGTGLRKPAVIRLGVDFAGTVEAVGRGVGRFKPGDEVFGGRTGAFAEYVTMNEDGAVALKPANLTFEQAAAVPIAAITALQGLRDAGQVQPGQRVLINGASVGAEVTGVCSTRNVDMVRSLGADRVIDYTREDFTTGEERYDILLDNVGNRSLSECRRVLNANGRYVLIGGGGPNDGPWIGPLARVAGTWVVSRFVSQDLGLFMAALKNEDLAILAELMRHGKVVPVIDRRYSLGDLPAAVRYLEEGHARGKVVITTESTFTR
jgi:NADPH:quinone reductase-like Zn-dependent oxidoreductase